MKKKNNTITISKLIFVVLVLSFGAIVVKLSYVALAKNIDGINLSEFVSNRNTETQILKAKGGAFTPVTMNYLLKMLILTPLLLICHLPVLKIKKILCMSLIKKKRRMNFRKFWG